MLRQMSGHSSAGSQVSWLLRVELFSGLFILGCANGLATRIGQSVHQLGWTGAIFATFNISVIVLVSCCAGVTLVFRDRMGEIRSSDIAVGAIALLLVILPIVSMSWVAVTALSLYILLCTDANQSGRRGAIILLATTVPMLWSRVLFDLCSKFILEIDASLVGSVLGTHRSGNLVEFADHSGNMVVLPGCSSLANMSLAFLCWVTVSQSVGHKWRPQDLLWCMLACISVIGVNVTRISLMGLDHSHYNAIHSQTGDAITSVIILVLTVGISVLGVKREMFSRA
jgi:exosortase/archaeosortase family protein